MKIAVTTLCVSACAAVSLAYPMPVALPEPVAMAYAMPVAYALPEPEPQLVGNEVDRAGKQPDGYFQYVNVPAPKEYEFGWNRGNPHHYISRYEQSKDHRFRTRVRWGDKHGGYGEHYWEYNHGPKDYKHKDHKKY